VTSAHLAEAERALGRRLPAAYGEALRLSNGGRLRRGRAPAGGPTRYGGPWVDLRDILGVGYEGSMEESARLVREWDYPRDCLVLSSEGPTAVLLDYRGAAEAEPRVTFVDTDQDEGGAPLERALSPDLGAFFRRLRYVRSRTEVALALDLGRPALLALWAELGAEGPAREDYEGGYSLSLPGWDSAETGPAILRSRENRRVDRTWALPELPDHRWIVETTLVTEQVPTFLTRLEALVGPGAALLLHSR
jgi:hypothetical protein